MPGSAAADGLAEALAALPPEGAPALEAFLPGLVRLLDAEGAAAFGVAVTAEGATLSFAHAAPRRLLEVARPLLEALLRSHPLDFGAFDPLNPQLRQRNVPVLRRELGAFERLPAVREVLAPCGLAGLDVMRVLVCDEGELLAWVGAFRRAPFTQESRRLLARLLPALRHRLWVERQLAGAPVTTAALVAALEAMGGAAFVLREQGTVVHANTAGLALLERDARGMAAELLAAVRGLNGHALHYAVMRLRAPGMGSHFLVLQRELPASPDAKAAGAALRWSLTPRQREVLALLASGASNKSVAAALGCAERTVELHVTALLGKAGCESRSELVAKVWREL